VLPLQLHLHVVRLLSVLGQKLKNVGPMSQIPSLFISLMQYVKETTHYLRRVRHEVLGVVAVLCDVGWVGKGYLS